MPGLIRLAQRGQRPPSDGSEHLGAALREPVAVRRDDPVEPAVLELEEGVPADQLLAKIKTDDIGWAPRVPKVDAFVAELSASK